MNCFIILLLLFCCGNNGVGRGCDNDRCDDKRGCEGRRDDCERRERCEDACGRMKRCDEGCERRERAERMSPWQDFSGCGRSETCGCEEKQ